MVTRTRRGTRHDDSAHVLVTRAVHTTTLLATLGVAVGWLAFGVAVVRCVLATPHP